MSIPDFDESGYLPPGIHSASLDEIEARFGRQSEIRRAQMESIRWLTELARRAGVQRIVLNGSFVTDIIEPNDVDCVLLIGADYPQSAADDAELNAGLPFIEMKIVEDFAFGEFINDVFATDRDGVPKGMVEIVL